jgi:thioredoxin-related protein
MKKIAITLLTCFAGLMVQAAQAEWMTDFTKAQAQAKAEKKLLLVNFTGSDWCPPCKALHKNVFATETFQTFAKSKLVLVEVDFPRGKEQSKELKAANNALGRQFQVNGYPTVVVLNSEGKELKRESGYGGEDAKTFVAGLQQLR